MPRLGLDDDDDDDVFMSDSPSRPRTALQRALLLQCLDDDGDDGRARCRLAARRAGEAEGGVSSAWLLRCISCVTFHMRISRLLAWRRAGSYKFLEVDNNSPFFRLNNVNAGSEIGRAISYRGCARGVQTVALVSSTCGALLRRDANFAPRTPCDYFFQITLVLAPCWGGRRPSLAGSVFSECEARKRRAVSRP